MHSLHARGQGCSELQLYDIYVSWRRVLFDPLMSLTLIVTKLDKE